jgi:hypothetical protein
MILAWSIATAWSATLELRVDGPATEGAGKAARAVIVEGIWEPGEVTPESLPVPTSATADDAWTTEPLRTERAAGRVRLTQRHVLSGPAGSRVIEPVCVDDALCSDALYVDLGPATPPAGMQDIVEPSPPPAPWPWGTIAAFTAVSGIAIGAWRRWRRPVVAAPATGPDDPAHVVALRRWEALRADPSLDDEARALALSELFRDYLAASLHIPARSLSTSEVLRALGGRAALRDGHLQGAERLLRATDRIKYAEDRPGADKFGIFDEDLRAFIGATRPVVEAGR